MSFVRLVTDVVYLQAYGCRLCIHVWAYALVFGSGEICTPFHWFRYSKGYKE